ncbi:MAG TPA: kynurenine 3-monooxygenase, partial [Myxococcales bacterium]|nr:kynurenine 3-monooxygenase [Myxococcales bacterium]
GLNELLLNIAEQQANVSVSFDLRCTDVDIDAPTAHFINRDGEPVVKKADLLIGCDGIFSTVRGRMMKTDRFDYEQRYLAHGYKELSVLPGVDGEFQLEPEALHIWPRGDFMLIALPNLDRSFTCTLFHAYGGDDGFDNLQSDEQVLDFFRRHFPDVLPVMPNLLEDWRANPVSSLATIQCAPFHHGDTTVLIGDSAHAVVPFYGQGMNAAFESASIFDQILAEHGNDLSAALPAFTRQRKADADAIRQLALDNFLEMRDHVADPEFLRRSAIEKRIQRASASPYLPLYSMVTFSNLPYAETIRRSRVQSRWLDERLAAASQSEVDETSEAFIALLLKEPPPVFDSLS